MSIPRGRDEVVRLRMEDLDASPGLLRVHLGKGRKDLGRIQSPADSLSIKPKAGS